MFHTRLQETKRLAFCRRTVLETHVCMCQIRAYRGPGPLRCSIGKLGRNWGLKAPLQSGKRLTAFRSEKSFRYSGCGRMGSGKLHMAPIVGNSCVLICLVRPRHFRVSAGNLSLGVVCLVGPFSRGLNLNATLADGLPSGRCTRRPSAHLLLTSAFHQRNLRRCKTNPTRTFTFFHQFHDHLSTTCSILARLHTRIRDLPTGARFKPCLTGTPKAPRVCTLHSIGAKTATLQLSISSEALYGLFEVS